MHINQFLAKATGMSRRAADEEIKQQKVTIDGRIANAPDRVTGTEEITWKGKVLTVASGVSTTIALYKPVAYVTSRSPAPKGEKRAPVVMELLPKELQHLKPVGRLDKESEGLLLLTDDGDFLYRSTHPKFETEKEYYVEFADVVHDSMIEYWKRGVKLTDGFAKADVVERLGRKKLRVVIHQGMNRQIRRMAAKTRNSVTLLRRVRSGSVSLGALKPGKWKKVTP